MTTITRDLLLTELRETLRDLENWDGTPDAMQAIQDNLRAVLAKADSQ